MKKIIFLFLAFLGSVKLVSAASISVTASSNYVVSGGKVTFYINIRDAGAWQLSGNGTGATSNCSLGEQGVGDTGTGKNGNKTLSVTCNATSVGQISFQVSGNVTDASSGKSTDVSGRKIVIVQAPREKDGNNYLKSLSVDGYTLSTEFQKDTLEYSVTVPSTVDKVMIQAETESGYATISGIGEFEVDDGANTKEIVVMSETGVERTYKVVIHVMDENPIKVTMAGKNYTILKNLKHVTKPELYEISSMKMEQFDIPTYVSDITGYTLVALKDENGDISLAVYDKDSNQYQIYQEHKSHYMILYLLEPEQDIEGYQKMTSQIDGISTTVFQFDDTSDFVIVYAMNVETGEKNYYSYHAKSNTFQLYSDEMYQVLKNERQTYQKVIYALLIGGGFFFLLWVITCFKKPSQRKLRKYVVKEDFYETVDDPVLDENLDPVLESPLSEVSEDSEEIIEAATDETEKMVDSMISESFEETKKKKKWKKKKEKKNKVLLSEEEKVNDSVEVEIISVESEPLTEDSIPETLDVKDALEKLNDAEEIIHEYEKTLSLSKEELRKAKESQEAQTKVEETKIVKELEPEVSNSKKKKKKKKRKK